VLLATASAERLAVTVINPSLYRHKAFDVVTAALELEIGTADIDRWYEEGHRVHNLQ